MRAGFDVLDFIHIGLTLRIENPLQVGLVSFIRSYVSYLPSSWVFAIMDESQNIGTHTEKFGKIIVLQNIYYVMKPIFWKFIMGDFKIRSLNFFYC